MSKQGSWRTCLCPTSRYLTTVIWIIRYGGHSFTRKYNLTARIQWSKQNLKELHGKNKYSSVLGALVYIYIIYLYKHLTNKATVQIGTTVTTRVFKRRTAGWKSLRNRKVLRPDNSIKAFRGLLGSRANAELVPKFHVSLHASHAALPSINTNFALQ
jgi:hypothetical protein